MFGTTFEKFLQYVDPWIFEVWSICRSAATDQRSRGSTQEIPPASIAHASAHSFAILGEAIDVNHLAYV